MTHNSNAPGKSEANPLDGYFVRATPHLVTRCQACGELKFHGKIDHTMGEVTHRAVDCLTRYSRICPYARGGYFIRVVGELDDYPPRWLPGAKR